MDKIDKIMNNTNVSENIYTIVGIIIVIIVLLFYILQRSNKAEKNCKMIKNAYDSSIYNNFYTHRYSKGKNYFQGSTNIGDKTIKYDYKLKDFYIKTAYNACCSGRFKNDYVDLCALENVARYGVRGLDFQIYSLNGNPIVAASSTRSNVIKESYNYLKLDEVMSKVNSLFLGTERSSDRDKYTKLNKDPLFLFLRIHYGSDELVDSDESHYDKLKKFYNKIHNILKNTFDESNFNSKIMGTLYSDQDKAALISLQNMKDIENRIFLFVSTNDVNLNIIKSTNLNNYVDMYMDGVYMKDLRASDLNSNDKVSISSHHKSNLGICYPDYDFSKPINYDFTSAMALGVQFCAMNFQNNDSNLKNYNNFFIEQYGTTNNNSITSPYIKKPDHLIAFPTEMSMFFQ